MTLEETYHEIKQILGNNADPLESVRLVEAPLGQSNRIVWR